MSNGKVVARRLADLLREPRETLNVELKEWLNVTGDGEDKARLAKALIALANHGGGYVVLGFAEAGDGTITPAEPRPSTLATYTPDTVNSVVGRYAEPSFHCDVQIVTSPETGLEHPIVVVPGGHHVPIRSKRSGPQGQIIHADRYYVRRLGPASEPPQSGHEWDHLIRRCIANAREELVDRFRTIVAGGAGSEAPESDLDRVSHWFDNSVARWEELVGDLPEWHVARLIHGHYAVGYQVLGDFDPPRGGDLLDALRRGEVRRTGWPPFWVPTRGEIAPYPHEDTVECWLGSEEADRDPAHADYWRASPAGQLFLMRGYQEDAAPRGIAPGTLFDVTLPIWRIGETLLHSASMAQTFGDERARVVLVAEWTGLAGRTLTSFDDRRAGPVMQHRSRDSSHRGSLEVQAEQIDSGLPELVHQLVGRLFERFDFFSLPLPFVAEQLSRMRGRSPL